MLRKEQNDLLTQTGPGTPMGRMFRSYWIPALLAKELPENECPPVRVKLLSERLLAFRDSKGRYGLIDEFCAHRGVSLWFGRNEECGLRCPYHGWKYDCHRPVHRRALGAGRVAAIAKQIKLKSYPLVEARRRAVDLYGPAGDSSRRCRSGNSAMVPAEADASSPSGCRNRNWLQAMEGGINSSHVSFLHRGDLNTDPLFKGVEGQQVQSRRHEAGVRGGREPRRPLYRRPPQCRERQLLLAHHAMGACRPSP